MKNKYFKLYANCIPVKGVLRAGICDLQRSDFKSIPNTMYAVIEGLKNSFYNSIIKSYGKENKQIIDGYIDWLLDNDYGFWCDEYELESFPELELKWDSPYKVSNAIIDIDSFSEFNILNVFLQLKELGVPHIQIRSFTKKEFSYYLSLIELCKGSRINTIDIITPFNDDNIIKMSDLIVNNKRLLRVNSIIIYASPEDSIEEGEDGMTKIIYSKQNIENSDCCGKISPSFFSINLPMFTESNNFNTCLNRKISIDVNGEIKNCPSMQKSYGNIKEVTLKEALNKQGFKDLWKVKKDDIKICKDCEFRYICTDCRAFIDDSNDIYSHPAKCEYNPYQAKWKADEGYIPVTEMTIEEIENIKAEHA